MAWLVALQGVQAAVDDLVNRDRPRGHHAEVAHLGVRCTQLQAQRLQAAAHGAFQGADVEHEPARLQFGQAVQNRVGGP